MKKVVIVSVLSGLMLTGCSAINNNRVSATTPVAGLQSDNQGQYQYVKTYPQTGNGGSDTTRLQQCAVSAIAMRPGAVSGTRYGDVFTAAGFTSYSITSLGNPVKFTVNYTLAISGNNGGLRYVFSHIQQVQRPVGNLAVSGADTVSPWVGANPQQVVGAFNTISDQINSCLSSQG